jgi:hypothetical protein
MSNLIHYEKETKRFYVLNEKGEKEYVNMGDENDQS